MSWLILLIGVAAFAVIIGKLSFHSTSGRCGRCGQYSKRLFPNEDARKTLNLCKMCNAELEIERSLKTTREKDDSL